MKNIRISDVSLREIFKSESSTISFKEKLEIAKKIGELNVDVIEFGAVSGNKAEEVLIKTVCKCLVSNTISCDVGNTLESLEKNYSLIVGAARKRLTVRGPVSPVQMEYSVNKKPDAVLETLKVLTEKSSTLTNDVEVSLEDATRAEAAFLYKAIKIAVDAGATTVTVTDLEGALQPDEIKIFIDDIYANVPEISNKNLAIRLSDAHSMSIANVFSAMRSGVGEVKLSAVSGFNLPPIETFVDAMETIGSKKGFSCNMNKTGVKRIVKQIGQFTADKSAFTAFDSVIEETKEEINKNVSQKELTSLIIKRGYNLNEDDLKKVYEEFVRISERKYVNTKELDFIIANTALQVPPTYLLKSFSVNVSNVTTALAGVVLTENGEEKSGVSFGNGSIDAALLAIESITRRHFDLDDFEVGAVTEGKEAMGQTLIKLRCNGKLYSGRGISTDIVGASIRAYINAINKIVYEESL